MPFSIFASIVYIISAPASPLLGFMVDKTGKNVIWVMIAVVSTLAAHMMLAFTFWNPWIAMVMPPASLCTILLTNVLFLHVDKKLSLNFGLLVVANPWICCEDT